MKNEPYLDELTAAKVVVSIPVAWGEMDALNHVNNVAYYRYLETARVAYLERLGHSRLRPAQGESPASDPAPGFILQSCECRFRRPVVYPDTLRVTARCESLGDDRFSLTHVVMSTAQSQAAAIGRSVIVCYNYQRNAKSHLPESVRRAIVALDSPKISPANHD